MLPVINVFNTAHRLSDVTVGSHFAKLMRTVWGAYFGDTTVNIVCVFGVIAAAPPCPRG
jgi:hypothetical protein